jgi:RNA polymerase sigma factor (sigma-70 family)
MLASRRDVRQGAKNTMTTPSFDSGRFDSTRVDTECMTRLAGGDTRALRDIYERHGRSLLRFSAALCRSRQIAEDLVHDTFVILMREPQGFDPARGTLFGYLCGVLRHRISRHFRAEKRWVALGADDEQMPDHAHNPADEVAQREQWAAFRRAIFDLPLRHREVIALCDLEELPYAMVAEVLDCPIGTVRSRLHRARALLTLRLASLELIELDGGEACDEADAGGLDLPLPQRGLS